VRRGSRIFVGQELGFMIPRALWIDGKSAAREAGSGLYYGFHVGYSHALSQRFGVLGLTRLGTWSTPSAEARGEERFRVDVAVGPEIHDPREAWGWHVSAPLGVTVAQSKAGTGRAIQESYGSGHGLNFGLVVGGELTGRHSGVYFEAAWITHFTWIDHSVRDNRSGAVVRESFEYVDHLMLFNVGYLYRL
jgi:hypothetical protein